VENGSSLSFLAVISLTSAIGGAVIGTIADGPGVRAGEPV
jgi:hypothetical protein